MLKRIIAVSVVLVMCTPFAYAWNAESFIGLDQVQTMQEEVNESIYSVSDDTQLMFSSRPMMMAAANDVAVAAEEGEPVTKVSGTDFFKRLSSYGLIDGFTLVASGYQPPITIGVGSTAVTIPGFPIVQWNPRPMGSFTAFTDINSVYNAMCAYGFFSFDSEYGGNGGYLSSVSDVRFGIAGTPLGSGDPEYYDRYIEYQFDLSGFPSFNTFSLSGDFYINADIYKSDYSSGLGFFFDGGLLELFVNGSSVGTFSINSVNGRFSLSDFIYSSTTPISSIVFRVTSPFVSLSIPSSGLDCVYRLFFGSYSFNDVSFSILTENNVLNGANDQGQNAVNDLNALEANWTGQMTSNFNKLNISNFTYPDGLVPAFGLITGIFNDLWNIMGQFNIVYIFPLTLGVTLVVIGRLSKSSGSRSSSKSGKGG